MGINRKKYISTRPWKKAGMSLERFERITMAVPQEYLDEIRISAKPMYSWRPFSVKG